MTNEEWEKNQTWQAEQIEKRGYYVHQIPDQLEAPFINRHTHGLEAFDGGRNIRTVLDKPYTPYLVFEVAKKMMGGKQVVPNDLVIHDGVVYGYLIDDPNHPEDLDEENMLRLIVTRDYDTNELIDDSLIMAQQHALCDLAIKKGEA